MKTIKLSLTVLAFTLWGCGEKDVIQQPNSPAKVETYGVKILKTYPHNPESFTQGLLYHNDYLYESTGLWTKSTLRKVHIKTGNTVQKHSLKNTYFGEGLALWDNQLIQLTWHAGDALVYDLETFKALPSFSYDGEGWGLTTNKDGFILSDGTAELRFLDPKSFKEVKRLKVTDKGKEIKKLNELEFIDGKIFANVWLTNKIAKIDPNSGKVLAWIDLSNLVPQEHRGSNEAVLNGIAYDEENDRLFVTGKLWPKLYEIKLIKKK